jgi:hypothetical protein
MRVGNVLWVAFQLVVQAVLVHGQTNAAALRGASVTPAPDQPQQQDPAVLFYADFDRLPE